MKKLLMVFVLCFAFAGTANASLVFAIPDPTGIVNFDEFNNGWIFGSGPTQIGNSVLEDIVWTTNYGSSVIGSGFYGLASNGYWDSGRGGYTGLNTSSGTMRFDMNTALVNSIGGFINYAPGYGIPSIAALDSDGNVLETYTVDISTLNETNAGQFWGISRSSADIRTLALSNAYSVLDDLTFKRGEDQGGGGDTNVVPEPSTMLLFGTGLLGAFIRRRRRS